MQLPPWFATTAGGHHGRLIWVAIGSCEMPAVPRRRTHRLLDVKQSLSCCGAASVTVPKTHDGQVHLDKPRRRGCVPRPPPEAALEAGVGKCLAPMALGWAWLAGRGSPYPRKTESRLQTGCFVRGKGFCRQVSAPPLPTCVDVQLCWSWRSPKAPTGADPACSEAQVGDGPEWWNRMRQWHLQVVTTRSWASQPASGEAPGLWRSRPPARGLEPGWLGESSGFKVEARSPKMGCRRGHAGTKRSQVGEPGGPPLLSR